MAPPRNTLVLSLARFPERGEEVIRAVGGVVIAKTFPPAIVQRRRDRLKERLGAW